MRRIITVLSIVGFALGLALLALTYFSTIPVPNLFPDEPADSPAFVSFPLDKPRLISFDFDPDESEPGAPREQRDQSLDWLLFAVLSDAGLSVEQFNKVTFDLPPRRYGYLRPVANFEYGLTRSRFIGDGKVVALIPATSTPEERIDHLTHIFDEHRKNLGEAPDTLIVFDYEIEPDSQTAQLTRRIELDGKAFLSGQYGYLETEVRNMNDLTKFVAATDDITYAELRENGLVLGGRKLKTPGHLGVAVEDIAVLWQSEQKIHPRLEEFEQRWQKEEDALKADWMARAYGGTDRLKAELEKEIKKEQQAFRKRYRSERRALKIVQGSGFSLDPVYDFDRLEPVFKNIALQLQTYATNAGSPIGVEDIDAAVVGIGNHDAEPMLGLLDKMVKSTDAHWHFVGEILKPLASARKLQFQVARYDGDLRGTEVGMTLFYTDLLAKLWALNYLENTPTVKFADFHPMTGMALSPVFKEEVTKFESTRLWFGHQDKEFQIGQDRKSIILARNATRVYAASSETLEPGKETEPNAQSEAFLGWWNDHYEEVARYEPQYERLNEIMKWSLLLGWLNAANSGQSLGFLTDVKTDSSLWFPDWAKQQKDLKFTDWNKVGFYPRNYKGTQTEAMPILASKTYRLFPDEPEAGWTLSGGVSLAPKQLFEQRAVLSPGTEKLLRRSNLDYSAVDNTAKTFKTFGGANYRVSDTVGGRASVAVFAKEGAKLRISTGELGIGRFERAAFRSENGFAVEASAAGKAIGDLRIAKTGNGFTVGWRGRDLDAGQALGRRLSKSADLHSALLADPDVATVVQLPKSGEFVVKLRDSHGWLKLAPEDMPSANLVKGWDARVSDPRSGIQNIQLAWAENPEGLVAGFQEDGFIVIDSTAPPGKTSLRYEAPRGPPSTPPAEESVTFSADGSTFAAWRKDGAIRARWADLKSGNSRDPFEFARRIARVDSNTFLAASEAGAQRPVIPLPSGALTDRPAILSSLTEGKPQDSARAIAADPKSVAVQLNEYLSQELKLNQALMAEGRYVKAIQQIDGLIDMYGPRPELTLHKGIAQLERGRVERAAEALQETSNRPLRNPRAFFDEINARLKNSSGSVKDDNLRRLVDFAEWRDLQARHVIPDVKLLPVVDDGGHLRLHLHSKHALSGDAMNSEDVGRIDPKVDVIYIQDTPGLNNLDWSAAFGKSLPQLPSGKLPVVIKLNNAPIAHFQPDAIFNPDGATQFNAANSSSHPAQHVPGSYLGGSTPDRCSDESRLGCNQEQEGKPVYIITEPV